MAGIRISPRLIERDAFPFAEREERRGYERGGKKSRIPDHITAVPLPYVEPTMTPERKLLVAVLDDAVMTILRHACSTERRGARLREEALTWIAGRRIGRVTFEQCCAAKDLDTEAVADGVARHLRSLIERGEHRIYKRSTHLTGGNT